MFKTSSPSLSLFPGLGEKKKKITKYRKKVSPEY